jgi:hypothetical protein
MDTSLDDLNMITLTLSDDEEEAEEEHPHDKQRSSNDISPNCPADFVQRGSFSSSSTTATSKSLHISYDDDGNLIAMKGLEVPHPYKVVLSKQFEGRYFFLNVETNECKWSLHPTVVWSSGRSGSSQDKVKEAISPQLCLQQQVDHSSSSFNVNDGGSVGIKLNLTNNMHKSRSLPTDLINYNGNNNDDIIDDIPDACLRKSLSTNNERLSDSLPSIHPLGMDRNSRASSVRTSNSSSSRSIQTYNPSAYLRSADSENSSETQDSSMRWTGSTRSADYDDMVFIFPPSPLPFSLSLSLAFVFFFFFPLSSSSFSLTHNNLIFFF